MADRHEAMETRHIKKRIFTGATVGVTTLCGAPVGKKAWYAQDARDMYRLVVKCDIPAIQYSETWEFCPSCVKKLWPAPTIPRSAITGDTLN